MVAAVAVVGVVGGAGGTAYALRERAGARPFATTREMAERMGCAATFVQGEPYAGTLDTGRCRVGGEWVDLRVTRDADTALAWVDGTRAAEAERHHVATGNGWAVRAPSPAALAATARLMP